VAGGVAENAFSFIFTLITLFVFYAEGDRVASRARALFAHVFPERPPDYIDRVGGLVRAVVAGVLGTAVVQGVAAAIGFAIFGVPYAIGLGALTSLLSFLPGGTLATTLAAAAWLGMQGGRASAVGMLLWGVLVVGTLDSWLRPLLISRSGAGEIPFLLVLFGVLGGLAAFGLPGLLFGPVVLAVVFALLVERPDGAAAGAAGEPHAAPAPRAGAP